MNSLKVLVFILVFRDSCTLFTDLSSDLVISTKTSTVTTPSSSSLSNFWNNISITKDDLRNLNQFVKKLDTNVNVTKILNSLKLTVSNDGLLNLESLISNTNSTDHHVNFTEISTLLGVTDGVLDIKKAFDKLTKDNFTGINTRGVQTTEDEFLNFVGLGRKYNLPVEEHYVTTKDGYILRLFHVPGNGPSLLLSPGILDTSDTFLDRGEKSLVYIEVKNGYDIWVMNYRGTRYSRNHTTLDPDTDKSFWDFSMQEKGSYDLSACIDFVLAKTGRDQLSVIGHSEGTATVFVLTSTKPEYNEKIRLFIALSPVCYLSDTGLALKTGIGLWPVLNKLLQATGIQELLGFNSLASKVFRDICSKGTVGYDLCYKVLLGSVLGYSPYNLEQSFFHTFLGHYPAGASRKEVDHYVQIAKKNIFGQYDYGSKNIDVYGSITPPVYDLTNVKCNVSLIVAKNDKILGQKAARRLQGELPNVVDYYLVEDKWFNHYDFVGGSDAPVFVYQHVTKLLKLYT